jgi:hypothetical protein
MTKKPLQPANQRLTWAILNANPKNRKNRSHVPFDKRSPAKLAIFHAPPPNQLKKMKAKITLPSIRLGSEK